MKTPSCPTASSKASGVCPTRARQDMLDMLCPCHKGLRFPTFFTGGTGGESPSAGNFAETQRPHEDVWGGRQAQQQQKRAEVPAVHHHAAGTMAQGELVAILLPNTRRPQTDTATGRSLQGHAFAAGWIHTSQETASLNLHSTDP